MSDVIIIHEAATRIVREQVQGPQGAPGSYIVGNGLELVSGSILNVKLNGTGLTLGASGLGLDASAYGKGLILVADQAAARTYLNAELAGSAATAIAVHEGAPNPHPQYLDTGDGDARYVQLAQTYNDPLWLQSLNWAKITSRPDSLAGYGITDPIVLTSGVYSDPAWITALNASKLTGTIDPARLPVLPGNNQVISSGAIADLTGPQQAQIELGTIVTTTDGRRWVYTGSGSKTLEASYINIADVTPEWVTIANRPTTLSGYGITDAQPLDADLTAIAALTTTNYGRTFLTRNDSAAARSHMSLGTVSVQDASSVSLSGGSIDGIDIGLVVARAGAFTYVGSSSATFGIGHNSNVYSNGIWSNGSNNVYIGQGQWLDVTGATTTALSTTPAGYQMTSGVHRWYSNTGATVGASFTPAMRMELTTTALNNYTDQFNLGASSDVSLNRDAANVLAQRNGATAQTLRVYNTYTDASNYERGIVSWSGNAFIIGTQNAGSGIARVLRLMIAGTSYLEMGMTALYPVTNNSYDFGTVTNKARSIYAATSFIAPDSGVGYTFAGDTTTGISRVASGAVGTYCSGALAFLVTPTGMDLNVQPYINGAFFTQLNFYSSSLAADQKRWRIIQADNYFQLDTVDDAYSVANPAFTIFRSGNSPLFAYFTMDSVRVANPGKDRLRMTVATAGSGAVIDSVNAAENAYTPMQINTSSLLVLAGGQQAMSLTTDRADFSKSIAGGPLILSLVNQSNTAGSFARQWIYTAGASAGDAMLNMGITGIVDWGIGVVNADAGALVIAPQYTLGALTKIRMPISGAVEFPANIAVGTHSAIGAETVTGFITIKDLAGNDRKVAVVS